MECKVEQCFACVVNDEYNTMAHHLSANCMCFVCDSLVNDSRPAITIFTADA